MTKRGAGRRLKQWWWWLQIPGIIHIAHDDKRNKQDSSLYNNPPSKERTQKHVKYFREVVNRKEI